MRKTLSLFAAVLFAGSMMAGTIEFSGADFTGGTANTGSAFSVTKNGVTVSANKAYGTGSELRVYATGEDETASELTVSAGSVTITKITPEFAANNKLTFEEATPNATSWSIEATKQIRLSKLTVTVDGENGTSEGGEGGSEGGEGGETPDPEVPTDTLSCANAAALAIEGNTDERVIKGYVTEIVEVWSTFKNVSFWMADAADGGQVFEAYRVKCETEAEAPVVGDLVWVKGNLTKYTKSGKTIAETKAGGSFGILEAVERPAVEPAQNLGPKTIAEFLELKNTKDTCVITGVVSNITNTTYGNYDLVEIDNAEVSVSIYGTLTPEGAEKQFESLGVAEGDTLTVKAIYREYNGNPQPKNVIFVSVIKGEGGSEGTYTYDYEPTEQTAINMTFPYVYYEDYTADEGIVYFGLSDAEDINDASNWAEFYFFASAFDTKIPAGTYPINDSGEEGTVQASPGGDDESDIPSYLGVPADEEGYYNPYYFVSGTVTVAEDGSIVVNAVSYNGSTITLTYTASQGEGIEETLAEGKAVKVLRNGQVVILKGDKAFNTMGQIVR